MRRIWNRLVWLVQQVRGHRYESSYTDAGGQRYYVTWRMRWGRCYDVCTTPL